MRICVTGVGLVSSLAPGAKATFDAICAGKRGIHPVSLFDVADQRSVLAAEIQNLPVSDQHPGSQSGFSRTDAFAIAAAKEALEQSGLSSLDGLDLVFGSTTGPSFETEEAITALSSGCSIAPELAPLVLHPIAQSAHRLREVLGPFGKGRCISSACSTGLNAIILGSIWIRSLKSSRVLVGASDALCRLTFTGFNALGAMDLSPCRPFDKNRAGLSLGEGAAFLVLESEESALRRGAKVLAEIGGFGIGSEAHHITQPDQSASIASAIIAKAIASSRLTPSDIGFVNAHGTATPLNDPMEIKALRMAMGKSMGNVPIFSNKGHIGHTLGAAGTIESVLSILSLQYGCLPPTAGLTTVDPACEANHVVDEPRTVNAQIGLTNSFGFGGLDSSLVLARPGFLPDISVSKARKVYVVAAATADLSGTQTAENSNLAPESATPFDPLTSLDLSKARRLWRTEQWLCCVLAMARDSLEKKGLSADATSWALVSGLPNGRVDEASRFLHRAQTRGPRSVSPAEFPNLMLSSAAGHSSIYHHIQGPVLASTEIETSSESALVTAFELVLAEISPVCAALGGEGGDKVASVIRKSCQSVSLSEGAGAIVLASELSALSAHALAEISDAQSWVDHDSRRSILDSIELSGPATLIVRLGENFEAFYLPTSWASFTIERAPLDAHAQPFASVLSWLKPCACPLFNSLVVLVDRGEFGAVFHLKRKGP